MELSQKLHRSLPAGAVNRETLPVSFTVVGVERVQGRGKLVGIAIVEIDIGGIVLTLQGVQVLKIPGTKGLTCSAPMFRNPRDGQWIPSVLFPEELTGPLEDELLAAYRALG